MNRLLNKLVVFTLCIAVYFQHGADYYAAIPAILVITYSAICEYTRIDIVKIVLFCAFCIGSGFYLPLLYFLPLACYDIWVVRPAWIMGMTALPLVLQFAKPDAVSFGQLVVLILLSWLTSRQTTMLERQKKDSIALRDSATELSTKLTEKNKELLEKQEYEVNLATLRERNRIAREMHDTVGHLLSSSILQTGALLATCKDEAQREGLKRLHETLSKGMDSVRSAIHDLHDESIDLYAELESLIKGFTFCPVTFEYSVVESPDRETKYAFIAIVKEALSNIARHSNATRARVEVYEHPALYQLVVRDNGTTKPIASGDGQGMGLKNILDRVENLGGYVNISTEHGFELFISIKRTQNAPARKELTV